MWYWSLTTHIDNYKYNNDINSNAITNGVIYTSKHNTNILYASTITSNNITTTGNIITHGNINITGNITTTGTTNTIGNINAIEIIATNIITAFITINNLTATILTFQIQLHIQI